MAERLRVWARESLLQPQILGEAVAPSVDFHGRAQKHANPISLRDAILSSWRSNLPEWAYIFHWVVEQCTPHVRKSWRALEKVGRKCRRHGRHRECRKRNRINYGGVYYTILAIIGHKCRILLLVVTFRSALSTQAAHFLDSQLLNKARLQIHDRRYMRHCYPYLH